MALFPKTQSPCPYQGDLSAIMDGDMCRLCKRQVYDLTAMSDDQRVGFMKGCTGEVCVSYRSKVRPVIAAAALAAAAIAAPTAAAACSDEVVIVTAGGIKDLSAVQYVHAEPADKAQALPVVYDDKPAAPAPTAKMESKPEMGAP